MLTIAARGDLNDKHGTYPDDQLGPWCGGATDAKVRVISEIHSRNNVLLLLLLTDY